MGELTIVYYSYNRLRGPWDDGTTLPEKKHPQETTLGVHPEHPKCHGVAGLFDVVIILTCYYPGILTDPPVNRI